MNCTSTALFQAKKYETPNRRWVGFADAGEDVPKVDPKIKGAMFNMYDCFDRIGEGIFCIINVEAETGNLVLGFNKADVKFLRSFKINVEEWLDEAYYTILGHDIFQPQDIEDIEVLLLDSNGIPCYETPSNSK